MSHIQFVFTDTGERRYPRGEEHYFLVDMPTTIHNAENSESGTWTEAPEKYAILKQEAAKIWFQIESSRTGAEDWYNYTNKTYDTFAAADAHKLWLYSSQLYEFRIVKKTLLTEVVNG